MPVEKPMPAITPRDTIYQFKLNGKNCFIQYSSDERTGPARSMTLNIQANDKAASAKSFSINADRADYSDMSWRSKDNPGIIEHKKSSIDEGFLGAGRVNAIELEAYNKLYSLWYEFLDTFAKMKPTNKDYYFYNNVIREALFSGLHEMYRIMQDK